MISGLDFAEICKFSLNLDRFFTEKVLNFIEKLVYSKKT